MAAHPTIKMEKASINASETILFIFFSPTKVEITPIRLLIRDKFPRPIAPYAQEAASV
ncbi:hypothetical protein [Halomonas salifodinae]|uniref:hypothetical protein n=1 Tax=Halomonas salifodinae TaxID=438745 RepID=UPI0033A6E877